MTEKREIFLTPEGEANLRQELAELTGPRRNELARRLRHAISQGDLSENADYIAAKEQQAFLEGKIQEIEAVLRAATIVENGGDGDRVEIGSTVIVKEDGRDPDTYHLVGIKEADPRNGKISNESPIGKALLGKKVGEIALAKTPAGDMKLEVLEIKA
ncbi:MAG: transcription elongation factor GreA [Anaerolineales bacterium]